MEESQAELIYWLLLIESSLIGGSLSATVARLARVWALITRSPDVHMRTVGAAETLLCTVAIHF